MESRRFRKAARVVVVALALMCVLGSTPSRVKGAGSPAAAVDLGRPRRDPGPGGLDH